MFLSSNYYSPLKTFPSSKFYFSSKHYSFLKTFSSSKHFSLKTFFPQNIHFSLKHFFLNIIFPSKHMGGFSTKMPGIRILNHFAANSSVPTPKQHYFPLNIIFSKHILSSKHYFIATLLNIIFPQIIFPQTIFSFKHYFSSKYLFLKTFFFLKT